MTIEEDMQALVHRFEKLQEEIAALARSTGEWNPPVAAVLLTLSATFFTGDISDVEELARICQDFSRRKIAEIQRRRRDGHDA